MKSDISSEKRLAVQRNAQGQETAKTTDKQPKRFNAEKLGGTMEVTVCTRREERRVSGHGDPNYLHYRVGQSF